MAYDLSNLDLSDIGNGKAHCYVSDDYHKHAESHAKLFMPYNAYMASQRLHEFEEEGESPSNTQENILTNKHNMTPIQKDK